jgi:hypothetical protein
VPWQDGVTVAEDTDHADKIVTRIRVGLSVVDEERITGGTRGDSQAIGFYHLGEDGLIDRVRFLG